MVKNSYFPDIYRYHEISLISWLNIQLWNVFWGTRPASLDGRCRLAKGASGLLPTLMPLEGQAYGIAGVKRLTERRANIVLWIVLIVYFFLVLFFLIVNCRPWWVMLHYIGRHQFCNKHNHRNQSAKNRNCRLTEGRSRLWGWYLRASIINPWQSRR